MSLISSPTTYVVNTIDRIWNFRFNRQEGKSVVGEYYEPAAPIAQEQTIIAKQDLGSKTVDRSLVSYRSKQLLPDGVTYKPIIINYTVVCDKQHTAAQRDEAQEMMAQIIASDGFRTGISSRLV